MNQMEEVFNYVYKELATGGDPGDVVVKAQIKFPKLSKTDLIQIVNTCIFLGGVKA